MKFDVETFGWLNDDGNYMQGWSNVTMADLWGLLDNLERQGIKHDDAPDVFKSVNMLTELLSVIGLGDEDGPVLGVKVDEGDVIEAVTGPAIFGEVNEDGSPTGKAVLRVGNNSIPIVLGEKTATIGSLAGDIELVEYGDDKKSYGVTFEYSSDLMDDEVISLGFIFDTKNRPEVQELLSAKAKVKRAIKDGGFVAWLRPVPSGESFVKPRDLEVGEYSVVTIEENKPHPEYGRSWKVVLEGVGAMMTTGKRLNATLARQSGIYTKWLNNGNPLTFAISKKEEMSQGIRVDCGFFKREPKAARLVAAAKAIAPMPTTEALPEVAPTKTVEVAAVAAEPVQPELPVEDIPF